ncbi:MAG TPA: IS1 family transposase, partial [Thermoplasmatales archaeon]|nr:IS1 family transposase [Thermoplasmatales archaeon]
CPYCSSSDVVKYGFQRDGIQRYRCNTCRKIFNQRYGTLFYKEKIKVMKRYSRWFISF